MPSHLENNPSGQPGLVSPGPVLALTGASLSAVGLIGFGRSGHAIYSDQSAGHVEGLIPLADAVLARAGAVPGDLAAVAVGRGPAPYTGLRIALATAQALGSALGLPVWGVSDLDVLVADAVQRFGLTAGVTLVSALDAKRREVYWARYRVDQPAKVDGLTRLEGPAVSLPAAVPGADLVVGPGSERYAEVMGPAVGGPQVVDPVILAHLAVRRASLGQDVSTRPLYLRRPDVRVPDLKRRVSGQ
ncbi:MAG: tRNA (adenosine(37)-N6)-threonylcarbamoyltransferase complex dimerization subunit type 1 TsaB [Bifidobacteriaceae bacterium]|nr:tRNA (adenosine(37)-N6)-threonylcarbamoyltransferase complex dimerization subunit type 1 TsaB [Bifidobacteriaceae bacterium]